MVTGADMGPRKFSKMLRDIQSNDNDCIIAISGARGIGKSVFAMETIRELIGEDKYYNKEGFEKHNIYDRKELIDALKGEEESIINVDEAITSIFKREFQNKQQNRIIKLLNMYRDKRHIIFFIVPHFWDFDSAMRTSLIIKFWVHVAHRGLGYIFTHQDNPFNWDPWAQKYNMQLWSNRAIYKSPNFVAKIGFKNIKPDIYNIYKNVKAKKRIRFEEANKENKVITKTEIVQSIMKHNPNAKPLDIAKVIGSQPGYVYSILKYNSNVSSKHK